MKGRAKGPSSTVEKALYREGVHLSVCLSVTFHYCHCFVGFSWNSL